MPVPGADWIPKSHEVHGYLDERGIDTFVRKTYIFTSNLSGGGGTHLKIKYSLVKK